MSYNLGLLPELTIMRDIICQTHGNVNFWLHRLHLLVLPFLSRAKASCLTTLRLVPQLKLPPVLLNQHQSFPRGLQRSLP